MIKLMKYLKKSAGYVVLIIALLFLQAYCDLSLPDYTSKIVNVGIQQSGIEDSVPEKIRKTSMDNLKLFMDEEDKKTVDSFYEEAGDNLVLKDDVKSDERDVLNDILAKPMMIAASFSSGSDEVNEMLAKMGVTEGTDPMQAIAQMPEEALASMIEKMSEKIDKMQPSILTQAGVAYVKSEYEAMGEDVDAIQMHYIKISGIKMLGMALITMLCAICVVFLSSRVAAALGHDLRNAVYNKVISFSSREYHKFSTASLITRCTNDIQQVQQVMAMFFRIVLYAPILGIGGVIRVLKTDSSMTWILGLAVGLILVVIVVLFQVAMPKFTILQTLVDKLNLVTREILTGIPVIRAFSREKHEEERFEEANLRLTKTNLFVNRCMTFMMPTMMLIMNGVSVLIIYSGSYAVDNGTMQVGNVMAFIQYAMQIIMSFLMITAMSIMLPRANVAALRINDVLKTKVSVIDPENPVQPDANVKGTVEFDHVSFAYPEAGENVISDISFKAEKGETIAVIGSTGSGKSTLIKLILKEEEPTSGNIIINGKDTTFLKQSRVPYLRRSMGVVFQDFRLLPDKTVYDNVAYAMYIVRATPRHIRRQVPMVLSLVGLSGKAKMYPNELSGGEQQRVALARALVNNPSMLIADEPTGNLDPDTAWDIMNLLNEINMRGTTVVVATHAKDIVDKMKKRVIHIEKGTIVRDDKKGGYDCEI